MRRICVLLAMVGAALPGRAEAGCGDGGCGHVLWAEVLETDDGGAPVAAQLHGGYAWESSADWRDHPIAGTLAGFLWLVCDRGAAGAACRTDLAAQVAKAGTSEPLHFGGRFMEAGRPLAPPFLHPEGTVGTAVPLAEAHLGFAPNNPAVCPTALALTVPTHEGAPVTTRAASAAPSAQGCTQAAGGAQAGSLLVCGLLAIALRQRRRWNERRRCRQLIS